MSSALIVYADDIIIFSQSIENHLKWLRFLRLTKAYLKLKLSKYQLAQEEVNYNTCVYLSHVVSSQGVKTDSRMTKTVREYPAPTDVKHAVVAIFGLANYYRRFVQVYAAIAVPY